MRRLDTDFWARMLTDCCSTGESWRHTPEARLALAVIGAAFNDLAGGAMERRSAEAFIRGPALDFWARLGAVNPPQIRERLVKWLPVIEQHFIGRRPGGRVDIVAAHRD